jgi:hypothetical protein
MSVFLLDVMRMKMEASARAVDVLSAKNAELTIENERVRNLLTGMAKIHEADQVEIERLRCSRLAPIRNPGDDQHREHADEE